MQLSFSENDDRVTFRCIDAPSDPIEHTANFHPADALVRFRLALAGWLIEAGIARKRIAGLYYKGPRRREKIHSVRPVDHQPLDVNRICDMNGEAIVGNQQRALFRDNGSYSAMKTSRCMSPRETQWMAAPFHPAAAKRSLNSVEDRQRVIPGSARIEFLYRPHRHFDRNIADTDVRLGF